MIYLSGVSNPPLRAVAQRRGDLGLLITPDTGYRREHLDLFKAWAADNACFAQGARFSLDRFLGWLDGLPREGCLFAPAPDVVGDALQTYIRSAPVLPTIRQLGFRAALVAQEGLRYDEATDTLRIGMRVPGVAAWWDTGIEVPWAAFDVLFLGGSTSWKVSHPSTWWLAAACRRHGKWIHCGRVNSFDRIEYAAGIGCDSADGTFLAFGPDKNLPQLVSWLDRLAANADDLAAQAALVGI